MASGDPGLGTPAHFVYGQRNFGVDDATGFDADAGAIAWVTPSSWGSLDSHVARSLHAAVAFTRNNEALVFHDDGALAWTLAPSNSYVITLTSHDASSAFALIENNSTGDLTIEERDTLTGSLLDSWSLAGQHSLSGGRTATRPLDMLVTDNMFLILYLVSNGTETIELLAFNRNDSTLAHAIEVFTHGEPYDAFLAMGGSDAYAMARQLNNSTGDYRTQVARVTSSDAFATTATVAWVEDIAPAGPSVRAAALAANTSGCYAAHGEVMDAGQSDPRLFTAHALDGSVLWVRRLHPPALGGVVATGVAAREDHVGVTYFTFGVN